MSNRKIFISEVAIEKMKRLTELYTETENAGFIFGRMNPDWVHIVDVSDAGSNAIRTFSGVELDNKDLIRYVEEKILSEQYLIGTWHSHPRGYSLIPSQIDLSTMKRINHYFEETYRPLFIITNIQKGEFKYVIYQMDKNGLLTNETIYKQI